MAEAAEQYMLDYESKSEGGWFSKDEIHVTKEQLQQFMNFAAEKSVVEFVFEAYNPDSEFTKMILQAMTDYFLNSMMDAQDKEPELALQDDDDKKGQEEPVKQAEGKSEETTYKINKRKLTQSWAQKDQVIKLEAGLATNACHGCQTYHRNCRLIKDPVFEIHQLDVASATLTNLSVKLGAS